MCILTRQVEPTEGLIRFVLDPEGKVVADLRHRLPGRGVWVSARQAKVREAARKRLFAKAFGAPVSVDDDLADRVEERLTALVLGALGLARKAGSVITGAVKVNAAIARGDAIAVFHASDAAPDGVRKLQAAVRRSGREVPTIACFTSGQLDLALGGPNVIHAALLAGRSGEDVLKRVSALLRYQGAETPTAGGADVLAQTESDESGTEE